MDAIVPGPTMSMFGDRQANELEDRARAPSSHYGAITPSL